MTPKSALEIEYKEAMETRDRAKQVGNNALRERAEKRMAEIQVAMFRETAHKVGASENPKDFERAFKRVVKASPPGRA